MCPCPGMHKSKHCQQAEGGDPALEGHSWSFVPLSMSMHMVEWVQQGATNISKGQEEKLRELGLFSLQNRKAWGEYYQCIQISNKVQRWWRQAVSCARTRGNRHKPLCKMFHLNTRTHLFTVRMAQGAQGCCGASIFGDAQNHLDIVLWP